MEHMSVLRRTWKTLKDYKTPWLVGSVPMLFSLVFGTIMFLVFFVSFAIIFAHQVEEAGEAVSFVIDRTVILMVYEKLLSINDDLALTIINHFYLGYFVLLVSFQLIRSLFEVSMIQMVNQYMQTGQKAGFWQGLNWWRKKSAWRVVLMNIVFVSVNLIVLLLTIFGLALMANYSDASNGLSVLMAMLLLFGLPFIMMPVNLIISVIFIAVVPFIFRACVIEDLGIVPSIRRGIMICRTHLKDLIVLILLLFVVFQLWMFVLYIVLFLLFGIGILGSLGAFIIIGLLSGLFTPDANLTASILPLIISVVVFFILTIIPWTLIMGIQIVFSSIFWTVAYSEFKEMDASAEAPEQLIHEPAPGG